MQDNPRMRSKNRKAVIMELIGAAIFFVGLGMYFQPPGEELFTLIITLPTLVRLDVASATVMTVGALFWAYGKATRHAVDTKITADKQKFRREFGLKRREEDKQDILWETEKAIRNHYYMSWAYVGVLFLIVIAIVADLIDKGFIFKNILMFVMVGIVIAAKLMLHAAQKPKSLEEVQKSWS